MSTKEKLIAFILFLVLAYTVVGTYEDVETIKRLAPAEMEKRGWQIMRYEGYQYGSWYNHGGKVWYHVKDKRVKNTYYRVCVIEWGGELHFIYSEPEKLSRVDLDVAHD